MPYSERRLIENEMIFRRLNEKVSEGVESVAADNIKNDDLDLMWDDSTILSFWCECSDEDCNKRISLKLSVYKKIHENRDAFIIKPEHQVKEIEKVIHTEDTYSVVEKNKTIAEPDGKLNKTTVDNSVK